MNFNAQIMSNNIIDYNNNFDISQADNHGNNNENQIYINEMVQRRNSFNFNNNNYNNITNNLNLTSNNTAMFERINDLEQQFDISNKNHNQINYKHSDIDIFNNNNTDNNNQNNHNHNLLKNAKPISTNATRLTKVEVERIVKSSRSKNVSNRHHGSNIGSIIIIVIMNTNSTIR